MTLNHDHDDGDDVREVTILYATETGNAQEVAERLARFCRRLHFSVNVHSLDHYTADSLFSTTLVLFVIATTGSGREPRSMTSFWTSLLRADLPDDLFDHLDFAVFALGDSAYEKFCWSAKLLERRLLSLGAREIVGRGDADDQHQLGIDGALLPWMENLCEELLKYFPLPPGLDVIAESIPEPRVKIVDGDVVALNESSRCGDYFTATVLRNERITAPDWYQDVRHFEFAVTDDIKYSPGDIAVVHPVTPEEEVDSFLIAMGWANIADEPFTLEHVLRDQSLPPQLPTMLTLRKLFTRYLDFNAVPRRSFFALLRHFTADELEVEKLDDFLSPEGADDLYDYCQAVRRTIREVLEEFRNVKIPREYLFDLFPQLRPREFSIASSVHRYPGQIHLCVAIVTYRTRLRIPRRGIATTYLASLRPGDTLEMRIKKGFIALPNDKRTPVICVGPGTGIAPMRALVQERVSLGFGANTLYQGCRSATKDQHYRAEFIDLSEEKDSSDVPKLIYRVACSRDGPEGMKRTYVQDLITQDAERIATLIVRHTAWVYISGSSNKMPAAVKAAIQRGIQTHCGKTEDQARDFIATMEKEGRLIEDCWD